MPDDALPPEQCRNMDEVRAGVDATDSEMLALLARRFGYMRAAARIKQTRASVRDEARKEQVIANALARAHMLGLPGDVVKDIWERLVEGSIAYEFAEWDRIRGS
ncbi:MAG: chorismate mutase [Novosphingobium sp.]|nr:chorismate mutase [Novosphingobium sp.]